MSVDSEANSPERDFSVQPMMMTRGEVRSEWFIVVLCHAANYDVLFLVPGFDFGRRDADSDVAVDGGDGGGSTGWWWTGDGVVVEQG